MTLVTQFVRFSYSKCLLLPHNRTGSCCWISTRNSVSSWNLLTAVDLGTRSDTGKPNSSPAVAILPFLRWVPCRWWEAVRQPCVRRQRSSWNPELDGFKAKLGRLVAILRLFCVFVRVCVCIRVPQNCARTYDIMSFDTDGDHVRCRYGIIRNVECSVCNHPPGFTIDEVSGKIVKPWIDAFSSPNSHVLLVRPLASCTTGSRLRT